MHAPPHGRTAYALNHAPGQLPPSDPHSDKAPLQSFSHSVPPPAYGSGVSCNGPPPVPRKPASSALTAGMLCSGVSCPCPSESPCGYHTSAPPCPFPATGLQKQHTCLKRSAPAPPGAPAGYTILFPYPYSTPFLCCGKYT